MTFELVRYDAARKAIAAAHRVDEVKRIHDKATALLAYAKQAGDYELQNKAAEIRILAERFRSRLCSMAGRHPLRQEQNSINLWPSLRAFSRMRTATCSRKPTTT
jgi:hypothetical protein